MTELKIIEAYIKDMNNNVATLDQCINLNKFDYYDVMRVRDKVSELIKDGDKLL